MTEVSRRVGFYTVDNYEEAAAMLAATAQENGFKRMGVITADGTTYTTDHVHMDLSGRPYYRKGLAGENSVSDPLWTGRGVKRSMYMRCLSIMMER